MLYHEAVWKELLRADRTLRYHNKPTNIKDIYVENDMK